MPRTGRISIGNDIVDLESEVIPLHNRYNERVFSPAEREYIGSDRRLLWALWATKEAAYKAASQLSSKIFSPKSFEYVPVKKAVQSDEQSWPCEIIFAPRYVYALCASNAAILERLVNNTWVFEIDETNSFCDPSLAVRNLAIDKIAQFFPNKVSLTISNSERHTPPQVSINGVRSDSLLSFSHHGRFATCSFLPMQDHYC